MQDSIIIKIVDTNKTPIAGVYILKTPHTLLNTTDEKGQAELSKNDYSSDKVQIILTCLGFESDTISYTDLKSETVITLKEKVIQLPEAVFSIMPLSRLLPQIHKQLKNKYRSKNFLCRYHGNGFYSKAVECNGRTLQLRHEYGLFLTSGDCYRQDKWDLSYSFRFIPIYSARSFDFTTNGKDTLKYPSISGVSQKPEINYDATNRKIFTLIRSIHLFAPLFESPKYFNFKLLNIDSVYTIYFETKLECFPKKTNGLSRGTLQIDRETLRLKHMTFDYYDYYLYELTNNRPNKAPFTTQAQVDFAYDMNDHIYISNATCRTLWKYAPRKEIFAIERPSRAAAARNQLIEKESWSSESYLPIPLNLQTKEIAIQSAYAELSAGIYDQEFIKKHPNPFISQQATNDLSHYKDLEEQYIQNSGKYYWNRQQETSLSQNPQKIIKAKRNLLSLFYSNQK